MSVHYFLRCVNKLYSHKANANVYLKRNRKKEGLVLLNLCRHWVHREEAGIEAEEGLTADLRHAAWNVLGAVADERHPPVSASESSINKCHSHTSPAL